MIDSGLPSETHEFLVKNIDSLEELEVLLLLRSDPSKRWSVTDVNERIRSSSSSVGNRLQKLLGSGFVNSEDNGDTYRYSPRNESMDASVKQLAEVYRERRMKVIEAIFSKPLREIQSFSDAFKIRSKKSDG